MTKIAELEELFKHCNNTAEEQKQQDNRTYDRITFGGQSYRSTGTLTGLAVSHSGSGSTGTLVSTASTESKSLARSEKEKQLKRLTKAELAEKGSKGLCLICDQKLTPGHRCATPTLQVLLVDKESFADIAKVSLSSVASHTNNPTMRLKGILGGEEIVVLIDCGASNNFISAHLVERLGITVKDTPTFSLSLSNGGTVYNQGICKGVVISFPELQVVEDFLQLKMSNTRNYEVILGIKWLKTLGDVMANWQLFTMTFVSDSAYPSTPVVLTEDMAVMLTPERLKGVRSGDLQNPATREVLIKWKNYKATWESFSSIRKQFPEFHLEDKLAVWVGGISKTL
ncbi:hypothetical protein CTI12_AA332280 [Artemisia annua]|uniref:Reverse transcriptase domain-containing protein n=1 Tax=Artemisia annua TaxID=35608 RepID=A0A2U1MX52_ARTAN|nr:hypothetical protein CTI12_AA332280 [Artemisia annua]